MDKYRTKEAVVEAISWTGENGRELVLFCGDNSTVFEPEREINSDRVVFPTAFVKTNAKTYILRIGDYLIKVSDDAVISMSKSDFNKLFEECEHESADERR